MAQKPAAIIIAIGVIAFLAGGIFIFRDRIFLDGVQASRVCFGSRCFEVEVAATEPARQTGLMGRQNLDEGKGMLFVYEKPEKLSFWMKNTLIPLDMVWLDGNRKVVYIKENARPCLELNCPKFAPDVYAQYVLEVNAGAAAKIGLHPGDGAEFFLRSE